MRYDDFCAHFNKLYLCKIFPSTYSQYSIHGEWVGNFSGGAYPFENETAEENKTTSNTESLKIPEFLDCNITADVNTVIYDNLNLKDVSGLLTIKNQQANLKGLTSKLFDGILAITGNISTQSATPTFNINLGVDGFDIAKSFNDLALFQSIAPIANALQGKLNSTINLKGNLKKATWLGEPGGLGSGNRSGQITNLHL